MNRIEILRQYIDNMLLNMPDADVLQHCLYNSMFEIMCHEKSRYEKLKTEFGIA